MTSLAEEKQEQLRWRLLPEWAEFRYFDQLVENEFLAPDAIEALQNESVLAMVRFAAAQVPYYRERFEKIGLSAEQFRGSRDLAKLPVLGRTDLQENFDRLQPQAMPAGQHSAHMIYTSGSTGQRVRVVHSNVSVLMANVVKQRESRWFRYDPMGMLAVVRHSSDLPERDDGSPIPDGETLVLPRWGFVGNFFHTGACLYFGDTNPVARQHEWLDRYRPAYLTALASHLEHLALTRDGNSPPDYLKVILSITQQLTPAMEQCVTRAFGAAVNVNYGLNEAGIVATRCPEGGRYHVHPENCYVEIVDEDGAAVKPGEAGRLLVTALKNAAMPLIRYDSGDIAEAVAGPCPCGRTLPAFASIRGRYRRMAFLPPGTWDYWVAFQWALFEAPRAETASLRQYQLHQYRDGQFELRLDAASALPGAFENRVRERWREAAKGAAAPGLSFVYLQRIPKGPNRKFENFTSDYFPAPDATVN